MKKINNRTEIRKNKKNKKIKKKYIVSDIKIFNYVL